MKKILPFLIALIFVVEIKSQGYTWLKGNNVTNTLALYGTSLTPNPGNTPGSRYGMVSWQTNSTTSWVFGGYGYDYIGNVGYLQDLWKYDITGNTWTWMKGNNTIAQLGNYGTLGTTSVTNKPSARIYPVTWTDASGSTLFLFGGYGYDGAGNIGYLNDLWKYDVASNNWTWISGTNIYFSPGYYGTLTVGSATTVPGARDASASWSDASGNLWLFGGFGNTISSFTTGYLNDLWKYNLASNQWTWMGGSNSASVSGTYGTVLTPSSTNMPGSRAQAAVWNDGAGNFLMFGGYGYANSTFLLGNLNDMWKYNISSGMWTWMGGTNSINQSGMYSPQGVFGASYTPGTRYGSNAWKDGAGNFWLGYGYGNGVTSTGYLQDLWRYNSTTNQWAWMGGAATPSVPGTYGQQGVFNANNVIGARCAAVSWIDGQNNLYSFGGFGFAANTSTVAYLNDVWRYSNCVIPTVTINVSAGTASLCTKETTSLSAKVLGISTFTWSTGSTVTPITFSSSAPGNFNFYVTTTNANNCSYTDSVAIYVDACTGLNKILSNEILSIFPNPSKGKINFVSESNEIFSITISNSLGQIIFKKENPENNFTVDLNSEKGIYFYSIKNSDGKIRKGKIIVE